MSNRSSEKMKMKKVRKNAISKNHNNETEIAIPKNRSDKAKKIVGLQKMKNLINEGKDNAENNKIIELYEEEDDYFTKEIKYVLDKNFTFVYGKIKYIANNLENEYLALQIIRSYQ